MSERKTGNQNGGRQQGGGRAETGARQQGGDRQHGRYAGKHWENGTNRAGEGDRQGGEPRRAGGSRAGSGARQQGRYQEPEGRAPGSRYQKPEGEGRAPGSRYQRPEGEGRAPGSRYAQPARERTGDRRHAAPDAPAQDAPQQAGGADELPFLIMGRNAVREAIRSGRSIDRVLVSAEQDGSLRELVRLARDAKLVVRETDRKKLDELCMPFGHGGKTANHQGIVAYAAGMEYCTVDDILNAAADRGEAPFVVVLDGVEDPHNLGSIIRSAECAGAHGVIIGKRRSASVTAAAVKAAAGATAYMRVARVVNVSGVLAQLKRAGLWVAGADMAGTPMDRQALGGPLALVIGGEGGGLTKLVRESCDFLVSIPLHGQIGSLNAGVAAAVLMFEKRRQDAASAAPGTPAAH